MVRFECQVCDWSRETEEDNSLAGLHAEALIYKEFDDHEAENHMPHGAHIRVYCYD